jgi:hypothetical protein
MATSTVRKPSKAKKFAAIEHIGIGPIRERIGPLGLHMYAEAYLKAYESLPLPEVPFEPVRPYLLCHSVELGLKAFLSLRGMSMLELAAPALAHSLIALAERAASLSLDRHVSFTAAETAAVKQANHYYEGKLFEYPAFGEALAGYPERPDLTAIHGFASKLVANLRHACLEAR